MLKLCLVKNKEGCFPIAECRPRSGSHVNAGYINWWHQRRRPRLDVVSISFNDRCFQGNRLLKWLADKRNFIQRYASSSGEQWNTSNMYDLYSASMNFSSPTSQYPGYYPYTSHGNELQSCMQQANKQVDHFRSYDQYNMINNSAGNTTINSRVPPLSHPPLPIVDSNYYTDQSFYYKNYCMPPDQPQQQTSYPLQPTQYATPTTTEYCDEDRRSEKSSDNDQGKIVVTIINTFTNNQ